VFENRVLRRIFRTMKEEIIKGWRKLHNKKLCNLYSSPNIIRVIEPRMRWVENVARMRKTRNEHKILVRKPEGKRKLG
jgi:hypothetical protein